MDEVHRSTAAAAAAMASAPGEIPDAPSRKASRPGDIPLPPPPPPGPMPFGLQPAKGHDKKDKKKKASSGTSSPASSAYSPGQCTNACHSTR